MSTISYKDAGVDIDAGNSFVENIKPYVKSTMIPGVLGGIGSFAGAFELPEGYKKPVILAGTDGVGTKLKLAIDSGKFDTVGIDLVAMCSNDLICNFGEPLFFLDYYATAKLEVEEASAVVKGIAEGCIRSQCALIGGETAEMPGMYKEGDFDLAGFCVGIAEKDEMDRVSRVEEGDDFNGRTLIDTLLEPTRIYVKEFKDCKENINALAHITGGGIVENLPRVLPDNLRAVVQKDKVDVLPIFKLMGEHVEESEMYRAFNMGVGMIFVANKSQVDSILEKTDGYVIGEIISGEKGCDLV